MEKTDIISLIEKSNVEIKQKTGLSVSTICRVKKGVPPSRRVLTLLASLYSIDVGDSDTNEDIENKIREAVSSETVSFSSEGHNRSVSEYERKILRSRLTKLMDYTQLTYSELSKLSGVGTQAVYRYFMEDCRVRVDCIERFFGVFGLTWDDAFAPAVEFNDKLSRVTVRALHVTLQQLLNKTGLLPNDFDTILGFSPGKFGATVSKCTTPQKRTVRAIAELVGLDEVSIYLSPEKIDPQRIEDLRRYAEKRKQMTGYRM